MQWLCSALAELLSTCEQEWDLHLCFECSVLWVAETLILHFHIAAWNKGQRKNKPTPSLHGYFVLLVSSWALICSETTQGWQKRALLLSASLKRDKERLLDTLSITVQTFSKLYLLWLLSLWGAGHLSWKCPVVSIGWNHSLEIWLWLLIYRSVTVFRWLQMTLDSKSCDKYQYGQRGQPEHSPALHWGLLPSLLCQWDCKWGCTRKLEHQNDGESETWQKVKGIFWSLSDPVHHMVPQNLYMCVVEVLNCSTGKLMKEQGLRVPLDTAEQLTDQFPIVLFNSSRGFLPAFETL